jgi:spermidine synthase
MNAESSPIAAEQPRLALHGILIAVFSIALLSSALLMFIVQPMVAKTLLPALGGTPQVWSTCMVFFQAMLFGGYLHAHFSGRLFGLKGQAVLHLSLLGASLFLFPVDIGQHIASPDTVNPVTWLLLLLVSSIGVPVFLISATAPLLQKWIANTRHPAAADPYFLYVASNAGSLLALLGYPLIVEPLVGVAAQWLGWSFGFAGLAALISACAWLFWREFAPASIPPAAKADLALSQRIDPGRRIRWVLLSLAPSSLLLGVTTHITTDIAAVPLFWVVPLAIYLLTFVLAFAKRPPIPHAMVLRMQAFVLTVLMTGTLVPGVAGLFQWGWLALHLLGFFLTALVCHGELVRARPGAARLTEFYLWLSFGGVLGGALTALVAPVVFAGPAEYPLALVLACLLRPAPSADDVRRRILDFLLPVALALAIWSFYESAAMLAQVRPVLRLVYLGGCLAIVAMVLLGFSERPWRFGMGVGAMAISLATFGGAASQSTGELLASARSFFGIYKVLYNAESGLNVFVHGSTVHGTQHVGNAGLPKAGAYYHADGAFGQMFRALAPDLGNRPVGVVGLGSGGLACYGARGSSWTYFEIDPLVERIARDARYFTFLRDCPPSTRVVIGDARIMLQRAEDASFALLLVDAFTSDAIPTHLLTREAIELYLQKLSAGGVLALHVSNRYLDLLPLLRLAADELSLAARASEVTPDPGQNVLLASAAQIVVLARNEAALGTLGKDPGWRALPQARPGRAWTDDYVNILDAMRWSGR